MTVEDRFTEEMVDSCNRAQQECGYNPSYFRKMVALYGGVGTARRLLATQNWPDGFVTLWQLGRLDLTMEVLVLKPEYAGLFSDGEKATARSRLVTCEYDPDRPRAIG